MKGSVQSDCHPSLQLSALGSKLCYEGSDNDLLNQVREAISDPEKTSGSVEPEKIGKKVSDNVEHHSSDTKRGELN
ncbi:hypothetical protein J6590_012594 [Homalodisca vitripennis]|nr:hypothetical protein J6590_093121 [Homalodisca vitripennis]KAG8332827.1 hypothetical protein J6590_012594 [Homalodisca vitripennis]